ncbi:hypothetical protein, partial [Roseibacillus persicicus]|uniref:hypothetical protein n=1 Tax=Roseibacillus persicicus TaxID=454148 RepID=UPI0028100AF9
RAGESEIDWRRGRDRSNESAQSRSDWVCLNVRLKTKMIFGTCRWLLLFIWLFALPVGASFIAEVPLRDRIEKSHYILKIKVLETQVPFADSQKENLGEEYLKLCRCEVILRLKGPIREEGPSVILKNEIIIAAPASEKLGSLKSGEVAIVFCNSAGLVPTVRNIAWFQKIGEKDSDEGLIAEIREILSKQ